jgi:hypothetical protein
MAATTTPSFAQRFEDYRLSKTAVAWIGAACAVATIVVGFVWGGWVTGGTATDMATKAAAGANAKLAADVCAVQFNNDPQAATQLVALNKLDSWRRADFITQGGWAKISGMKEPITGAADLCAKQLSEPKL